jgi:hypothetical protein
MRMDCLLRLQNVSLIVRGSTLAALTVGIRQW